MTDFWPAFHRLQTEGEPFCCVTVVEGVGSVPGDIGTKMLVTRDGLCAGTVGGGKIEARALGFAREMLDEGTRNSFQTWNLQTDLGMTCGGVVRLFFETYGTSSWPIAIFGAGHIAQSLTRLLLPLDCQLTCYDTRPEWLEKLPETGRLRRVHSVDLPSQVASLSPRTFVLLMTMGHATDMPILRELLKREFPYIGVVGSKTKGATMRRALAKKGFSEEECTRFFCPIGLPIGTNHLQEISISIAAQLLQERDR